jgi:hypothetical protein
MITTHQFTGTTPLAEQSPTALASHDGATAPPGVVTGRPLTWLRVEGLAVAAAALTMFAATAQPWWLVPALLLIPDLSALGYLAGPRVGAWTYNLAHTAPLPLALLGAGAGWHSSALTVAGGHRPAPPGPGPGAEVRRHVRPQLRRHTPRRAQRPLTAGAITRPAPAVCWPCLRAVWLP